MRNISPSLLSADFTKLNSQIDELTKAGITRLHLDVMDGHFVPNLTFGPFIINQLRNITKLHLETHLMIEEPHKYLQQYIDAGSDTLIFHYEASKQIEKDLHFIKNANINAGIAINPDTNPKAILKYLDLLDYILIMSVFPGFGGQTFIYDTLKSMEYLVRVAGGKDIKIGVDGGVNLETINDIYKTGIDITIVGSGLMKAQSINSRYQSLLNA